MTTLRIIGKPFRGGIIQAKDISEEAVNGSTNITRTITALKDTWITQVPVRGSAHPLFPNAILVERKAKEQRIPGLVDVDLTYSIPAPAVGIVGGVLPPDEYTEGGNSVEAPIEAHPHFKIFATAANGAIFNKDNSFKGWEKTSPFSGYLTYRVPSITESVTKYYWSQPSSVSSLVGSVQDDHWLVVTGSIQRRYPYWTRTIVRIWSAAVWPDIIYPR